MKKDLIAFESPKAPISEAIRLLRTNISHIMNNTGAKVFMVTSSAPGDGKSWLTANLAISFSQLNQKVLIIDTDFRKGRQNKIFGIKNQDGFSNYLTEIYGMRKGGIEHENILKKIVKTEVPKLYLLPTGVVPPNPSELLEVCDIFGILITLRQYFDVIFVDVPPISIVADGLILANQVDYTILVAAAGKTKKKMIVDAKRAIESVNGKIAGVVLNQVPQDKRKDYNTYYSHYSQSQETKLKK